METKTPEESRVEDYVYKVFPNDLNSMDTVFGGCIMSLLDRLALVVAERHSEKVCVTVSIDAVHFLAPAKKGDNLIVKASINKSWNSSMEIGLKVLAENGFTRQQHHILSAYFTFVALDDQGKPTKIAGVKPISHEEKRRFAEAENRRRHRMQGKQQQKDFRKSFSKEEK